MEFLNLARSWYLILFVLFYSLLNLRGYAELAKPQFLDFQSPRTLGLAGTGRGGPQNTDLLYLNPSAMGLSQLQTFAGSYQWNRRLDLPNAAHGRPFHVAVLDTNNPTAAAGVGFARRIDSEWIHLGISRKQGEFFSWGIHGKRAALIRDVYTVPVQKIAYNLGISTFVNYNHSETDTSVSAGFVADNLIGSGSTAETLLGGRKVSTGIKVGMKKILNLYVDYGRSFVSHSNSVVTSQKFWGVAGELSLGYEFFGRGGFFTGTRTGWGAGISWMGPRLGIIYGYQKTNSPHCGFEHGLMAEIYM